MFGTRVKKEAQHYGTRSNIKVQIIITSTSIITFVCCLRAAAIWISKLQWK